VDGQTVYGRLDIDLFGNIYDLWIADFYPGETDPLMIGFSADPNQTGLSNGLNFLIATNPFTLDPALLPKTTLSDTTRLSRPLNPVPISHLSHRGLEQ